MKSLHWYAFELNKNSIDNGSFFHPLQLLTAEHPAVIHTMIQVYLKSWFIRRSMQRQTGDVLYFFVEWETLFHSITHGRSSLHGRSSRQSCSNRRYRPTTFASRTSGVFLACKLHLKISRWSTIVWTYFHLQKKPTPGRWGGGRGLGGPPLDPPLLLNYVAWFAWNVQTRAGAMDTYQRILDRLCINQPHPDRLDIRWELRCGPMIPSV
jgi:hypothetical protein